MLKRSFTNFVAIYFVILCLCIFRIFAESSITEHFPEDIPSPMLYPKSCNRGKVSHSSICDVDGILSDTSSDIIEGMMNEIIDHGTAQPAICLVYKMSHLYIKEHGSIEMAGEKFARSIHDRWGVGDKEKQNGILLFISIQDRMVFISTGMGVDVHFKNGVIDGIISHMRPALKQRDYSRALQTAVTEMDLILQNKAPTTQYVEVDFDSGNKFHGLVTFFFIILFFVILAVMITFCGKSSTQSLNNGQRALDRLVREVQSGESGRFQSTSCPICLEDFVVSSEQATQSTSPELITTSPNVTDASVSGNGNNNSNLRPMMLPCDHQFCFGCLSEYLKSPEGSKCPICRAPLNAAPGNDASSSRPPHDRSAAGLNFGDAHIAAGGVEGTNLGINTSSWLRRRNDINFRIRRMRALYPDVVDANVESRLQNAAAAGPAELAAAISQRSTEVTQMINDAVRRQKMRSSGSSGSRSRSFGGGRSSGGGGGRW